MANRVVQALAVKGVEAFQTAVLQQQLQICLVLCRLSSALSSPFLSFVLPVLMFRLSSCCVPSNWPPAYLTAFPSCFHCFSSYVLRFASFFTAYLPFAYTHLGVPACFCSYACYLSRPCTQLCSARNVGWYAKEILLHFIPQSAISRAEKSNRSFKLGWGAAKVFYIVTNVLVGLGNSGDLWCWAEKPRICFKLSWEAEETFEKPMRHARLGWEAYEVI